MLPISQASSYGQKVCTIIARAASTQQHAQSARIQRAVASVIDSQELLSHTKSNGSLSDRLQQKGEAANLCKAISKWEGLAWKNTSFSSSPTELKDKEIFLSTAVMDAAVFRNIYQPVLKKLAEEVKITLNVSKEIKEYTLLSLPQQIELIREHFLVAQQVIQYMCKALNLDPIAVQQAEIEAPYDGLFMSSHSPKIILNIYNTYPYGLENTIGVAVHEAIHYHQWDMCRSSPNKPSSIKDTYTQSLKPFFDYEHRKGLRFYLSSHYYDTPIERMAHHCQHFAYQLFSKSLSEFSNPKMRKEGDKFIKKCSSQDPLISFTPLLKDPQKIKMLSHYLTPQEKAVCQIFLQRYLDHFSEHKPSLSERIKNFTTQGTIEHTVQYIEGLCLLEAYGSDTQSDEEACLSHALTCGVPNALLGDS